VQSASGDGIEARRTRKHKNVHDKRGYSITVQLMPRAKFKVDFKFVRARSTTAIGGDKSRPAVWLVRVSAMI